MMRINRNQAPGCNYNGPRPVHKNGQQPPAERERQPNQQRTQTEQPCAETIVHRFQYIHGSFPKYDSVVDIVSTYKRSEKLAWIRIGAFHQIVMICEALGGANKFLQLSEAYDALCGVIYELKTAVNYRKKLNENGNSRGHIDRAIIMAELTDQYDEYRRRLCSWLNDWNWAPAPAYTEYRYMGKAIRKYPGDLVPAQPPNHSMPRLPVLNDANMFEIYVHSTKPPEFILSWVSAEVIRPFVRKQVLRIGAKLTDVIKQRLRYLATCEPNRVNVDVNRFDNNVSNYLSEMNAFLRVWNGVANSKLNLSISARAGSNNLVLLESIGGRADADYKKILSRLE